MRSASWLIAIFAALALATPCPAADPTLAAKDIPPAALPPAAPPVRNVPVDAALQQQAAAVLDAARGDNDPYVRAHAIEGLRLSGGPGADGSAIIAALEDSKSPVRTAAAFAAGDLKLAAAYPALLKHAADENDQVQVAVRYALYQLGDSRLTHDLEQFAQSGKPEIRGITAQAIGRLGVPSGVKILRPMIADHNAEVRLQVAEALWRLGDENGLEQLAASAISGYPDDQCVALLALAEPRDSRVIQHVRAGLTSDYTEVQLVAARGMGMLGSDQGYAIAAKATRSTDPRQRQLAAFALGAIGRADAQPLIKPLLTDDNADVRIAAATAMLQIAQRH